MDKQFSDKQTGYWGAVNTNNSTSGYAAAMSQQSWPQATANTTQGYGSTSNYGAKLTSEQLAAMSMYYAAQKKDAETYAMYYGATTTSADDRQKQKTSEGYTTSAYGALYGKSATMNPYDQKNTSGYNTSTSYLRTQDVSQQKPSEGYNTANHQKTNKLYGETNMNMTDSVGSLYGATKGYGNFGMTYGAGSSAEFPESSITGTLSMSYGSSMRAPGSSKVLEGTTQPSGNNKMPLEGSKGPGGLNLPRGTRKYDSGGANMPYWETKSPGGSIQGRFYGSNRQNPLEVIDLMDDSEDETERMPKRQARMGSRRLSREQDEFSGSPERSVDKGAYMKNKASSRSDRSWDELQFESEESRSPWKKRDSSYNREQWKHQDYKSADTVLPWKTRDASSNRGSSSDAFGKEVSGPPRRKRDASFDLGAWQQKDDLWHAVESEESRLSWNKRGASYDVESASSKNPGLYDRNENGRSWKERDASFDRGAWNEHVDRDREERERPWKRQVIEEERAPPLERQNREENRMPLWTRRPSEEEKISPWEKGGTEEETPLWKRRGLEEERLASLRRQHVEEDTMPPWKKRVMERQMLKERAMKEGRMAPLTRQGIEGDRMSTWKKHRIENERLSPSKKQSMEEKSMSPWKKQGMEEERLPPWKKRAMEEERMPSSKRQYMEDDEVPPWKRRGMEKVVFQRQMQESISSGMGDIEGSLSPWKRRTMEEIEERVPTWNREREEELEERVSLWKKQKIGETIPRWKRHDKERLRFSPPEGNRRNESLTRRQNAIRPRGRDVPLSKKQIGRALKKRLRDSDEDHAPVVPDGIAMMICDKRYPAVGLNEKQSKIIMDCLLKAMEKLAYNESPQFSTHKFMLNGMLSIICANEHTCSWLKKKIEALKTPWEGADLVARAFRVPMIIFIPGAEEPEDEVREALQKANPHFRVNEWEFTKKDILKARVEYTYLIDFMSFEVLKLIQFRPYYKTTRVLVKIVHSFKQKTAEGSKIAVDNEKKKGAELTEADILLNEATKTNEKEVKSNSDRHELTEAELSQAEILLRQIEQGEK